VALISMAREVVKVYECTKDVEIDGFDRRAVQNGFVSKQTASERAPEYTSVGEWERLIKEQKEQQQADLLYTLKTKQTNSNSSTGNAKTA
jgi:hypothetical protein